VSTDKQGLLYARNAVGKNPVLERGQGCRFKCNLFIFYYHIIVLGVHCDIFNHRVNGWIIFEVIHLCSLALWFFRKELLGSELFVLPLPTPTSSPIFFYDEKAYI
jgi:hypothetical protein